MTDTKRITGAIVFAMLFVGLSVALPTVYYATAPSSWLLNVESTDTDAEQDRIQLHANYQSSDDWPYQAVVNLYHRQPGGSSVVVERWRFDGFLENGRQKSNRTLIPDSDLDPGSYYIEIEIKIHTRYYATRSIMHTTDTFVINDSSESAVEPRTMGYSVDTDEIVRGNESCVSASSS